MDISHHKPSGFMEPEHQAARGFFPITLALCLACHHPGHQGGPVPGPAAGTVACTVPAAAPVARTRITQLPHHWLPPGERR